MLAAFLYRFELNSNPVFDLEAIKMLLSCSPTPLSLVYLKAGWIVSESIHNNPIVVRRVESIISVVI